MQGIIRGEVVSRIQNQEKKASTGLMYGTDYIVLKANKRKNKKKEFMYDYFPIKIFCSNIVKRWTYEVQEGDIVECKVTVECARKEGFTFDTRTWTDADGNQEKSPSLFPNISLDVFNDDAIRVIESKEKESKRGHNAAVEDFLNQEPMKRTWDSRAVEATVPESEDDNLPF